MPIEEYVHQLPVSTTNDKTHDCIWLTNNPDDKGDKYIMWIDETIFEIRMNKTTGLPFVKRSRL